MPRKGVAETHLIEKRLHVPRMIYLCQRETEILMKEDQFGQLQKILYTMRHSHQHSLLESTSHLILSLCVRLLPFRLESHARIVPHLTLVGDEKTSCLAASRAPLDSYNHFS